MKRRRINYARADIAKANYLNSKLDEAWINAVQRETEKQPMTPPSQPTFILVAGLYERTSTTGRTVHAGQWGKTRVYLLPSDLAEPTYWLAIRAEDYEPGMHGPALDSTREIDTRKKEAE